MHCRKQILLVDELMNALGACLLPSRMKSSEETVSAASVSHFFFGFPMSTVGGTVSSFIKCVFSCIQIW